MFAVSLGQIKEIPNLRFYFLSLFPSIRSFRVYAQKRYTAPRDIRRTLSEASNKLSDLFSCVAWSKIDTGWTCPEQQTKLSMLLAVLPWENVGDSPAIHGNFCHLCCSSRVFSIDRNVGELTVSAMYFEVLACSYQAFMRADHVLKLPDEESTALKEYSQVGHVPCFGSG